MAVARAAATSFGSLRTSIYASAGASSRLCTDCLRQYKLRQPQSLAPRRSLQTTTSRSQATAIAHRVQDLPSQPPPPPRNAGVPETSIAGGKQLDNAQEQSSFGETEEARAPQNDEISITEDEAQKTKPASTATQPASSERSARPARKSKLRPRKAAMTLTPSAVEQLRALLSQPTPQLIRVGVKNRGCSGLAYHLEYVDKPGMFDEAVEQDGVKVLIDSKALFSIIGSEMDWAEDKLARRFVFRNPNITEQCGCGESFSIS